MSRKKGVKELIGLCIALLFIWDIFFNKMVYTSKVTTKVIEVTFNVCQKFGEWYSDKFMESINTK